MPVSGLTNSHAIGSSAFGSYRCSPSRYPFLEADALPEHCFSPRPPDCGRINGSRDRRFQPLFIDAGQGGVSLISLGSRHRKRHACSDVGTHDANKARGHMFVGHHLCVLAADRNEPQRLVHVRTKCEHYSSPCFGCNLMTLPFLEVKGPSIQAM